MWQRVGAVLTLELVGAVTITAITSAWAHGIAERVSLGPGGVLANEATFASALEGRALCRVLFGCHQLGGGRREWRDGRLHPRSSERVDQPGEHRTRRHSRQRLQLNPAISADGRFVAFNSFASNLVPGDTNGATDIFVRDRELGTTRRVGVGLGGVQANEASTAAAVSANGRFVAFDSFASNLVPGDDNFARDVFVYDRRAGTTRRVSVGSAGSNGESFFPAISADGRFVAFVSSATDLVPGDTNNEDDIFVRDLELGATRRVSVGPGGTQGNGPSSGPALSADGRFVAFEIAANTLVPGDTNGATDIFVRDHGVQLHPTSERRAQRRPGQWAQSQSGALGGLRALGRLHGGRHQLHAGRHQRHLRRVRPPPRGRHHPGGEPRSGRRPEQRVQREPALSADVKTVVPRDVRLASGNSLTASSPPRRRRELAGYVIGRADCDLLPGTMQCQRGHRPATYRCQDGTPCGKSTRGGNTPEMIVTTRGQASCTATNWYGLMPRRFEYPKARQGMHGDHGQAGI